MTETAPHAPRLGGLCTNTSYLRHC